MVFIGTMGTENLKKKKINSKARLQKDNFIFVRRSLQQTKGIHLMITPPFLGVHI
jgi:hypothetical protein